MGGKATAPEQMRRAFRSWQDAEELSGATPLKQQHGVQGVLCFIELQQDLFTGP